MSSTSYRAAASPRPSHASRTRLESRSLTRGPPGRDAANRCRTGRTRRASCCSLLSAQVGHKAASQHLAAHSISTAASTQARRAPSQAPAQRGSRAVRQQRGRRAQREPQARQVGIGAAAVMTAFSPRTRSIMRKGQQCSRDRPDGLPNRCDYECDCPPPPPVRETPGGYKNREPNNKEQP